MKAVLLNEFGGPEMLSFGETEIPLMSNQQVLIKVHATSVNGPDIVQRQGRYAPPAGDSAILGLEVAGTVEKTGSDVAGWQVGDRVMALIGGGGYAQYATAYPGHIMRIPDALSFVQAACICETYLTAFLNLFLLGKLGNNQITLLHGGGGGVNTAAVHLCKQLVPDTRIMVTASPTKIDRVRQLGVHHVINYRTEAFAERVRELTAKRGADVILDHIGGPYLAPNMQSLAVGGRLLAIGVTGGIKAELNLALMMVKRQQIIGSVLRSRSASEKSSIITAFHKRVMPSFADQSILPLVSAVFPLERAREAHETMETSRHFGKIALQVLH